MAFSNIGRRASLAGALCAVLAVGGAQAQTAAPTDVFAVFKRVCADNGGAYARTTAAGEIQSWTRMPFPIPIPTGEATLKRKTIRAKKMPGGGFGMFFAGDGQLKGKQPAAFQMCAIAGQPADFAAVLRQTQAWMNQPAVAGEKGMRSFRYHQAPDGRRTPLDPGKLREIAAKAGPGTIVSVDIVPEKNTTVISYSIIKL